MNTIKKTISAMRANADYKKKQQDKEFIGSLPKDLSFINNNGARIHLVKKNYQPQPHKTKGSRHV